MSRWPWRIFALLAASTLLAVSAASAAAPREVRVGSRPPVPAGSAVLGALTPTTPIDTTVVLKPRDPAALQAYATAVSTPGSTLYHNYLSVSEFRQQFAPTDSQIAAVSASLQGHGLTPGAVSANGLAIPVHANAGAVSRGFAVALRRLRLRNGRTAFAPDQAPSLDASVAGLVQNVVGLDNLAMPQPLALRGARSQARVVPHVVTGGPQPCGSASGSGFYTADEMASAYRFSGLYGSGDRGAGQRVAIAELEPNSPADIQAYQACYGTSATVTYTGIEGGAGSGPGTGEAALDIEDVIGLAPQSAIHVYQAPNTVSGVFEVYNAMVAANAERVISTSWGTCEPQAGPTVGTENTIFQEAAVQGQSVFAASGDNGSSDCAPGSGPAVDDPASQPFVTGVGGTSLPSIGPPPTESVWNNGYGASGGGVSSRWPMPSYQSGTPSFLNLINSRSSGAPCGVPSGSFCREVPDVSADADPATGLAIRYNGSWIGIGGTSAATPVFAALTALINASSACGGVPVGFANPVLYGSAGHVYSSDFNDVAGGSNGLYPAGGGYDMASGLGSPQGAQLAANVCSPQVAVGNPGPQRSVVGFRVSMSVFGSDSAGYPLTYRASGLPPGLAINSSTGTISGVASAAGNYGVTVQVLDNRNRSGSATFSWTVTGPTVSRASLTGIAKGRPKLAFTLSAGSGSPAVTKLQIGLPKGLSFSRSFARGTVVYGPKGKRVKGVKMKRSQGALVVTLPRGLTRLRITIAPPALTASRSLVSAVKHKKVRQVFLRLKPTDARRFTSLLTVTLKKPS